MPIKRFEQYIRYEKRYSHHTERAYVADISSFQHFLNQKYDALLLSEVNSSIIRSYMVALIEEGVSSRSVNRKLTSLKTFYKFLQRENICNENPAVSISSLKSSNALPEFVSNEKLDTLFEDCLEKPLEDFPALRDLLLSQMLYATGMRVSEIVGLSHNDIDLVKKQVKVLGKRDKIRIIPLVERLVYYINNYISKKSELFSVDSEQPFFVTNDGNPTYERFVYRKINIFLNTISTRKKKSPHVLRHTFATHMLNNGADINAIKEILGHANLAATQIYTHTSIEQLKSVYKLAHPGH